MMENNEVMTNETTEVTAVQEAQTPVVADEGNDTWKILGLAALMTITIEGVGAGAKWVYKKVKPWHDAKKAARKAKKAAPAAETEEAKVEEAPKEETSEKTSKKK